MLKLIATPLFLTLAAINYDEAIYLCVIPGLFGFLSSMWFMYLMMALVHAGEWASLIREQFSRGK